MMIQRLRGGNHISLYLGGSHLMEISLVVIRIGFFSV